MKRYLPLILCVGFLAAGCAQLPVYRIPGFLTTREVHSLAVEPFNTTTPRADVAGYVLADRLAAALAVNGTYDRVYSHSDLNTLTGGRLGSDFTGIEAVLTGTITQYVARSDREVRWVPVEKNSFHHGAVNDHPHGPRRFKPNAAHATRRVVFIHNKAVMSVTATLLAAETGEIIHATTVPVRASSISEGAPPEWSLDQCLDIVMDQIISQLVAEFAVTSTKMTIDPGKALIVSNGDFDEGEWREQDEFTPDDQEMVVVVTLPDEAHLNAFDIIVRRKGSHEALVGEAITWDAALTHSGQVLTFDLADIAARGGGLGKYQVVFFAGDEVVMKQDFKIVAPE